MPTDYPTARAAAVNNEPCFYVDIPPSWSDFKFRAIHGDGYLWNEPDFDLQADSVDVPSADYSLSFSPSTFSLGYSSTYSTSAGITACGTTTAYGISHVVATIVVEAKPGVMIAKRNVQTTSATFVISATLDSSPHLQKKDVSEVLGDESQLPVEESNLEKRSFVDPAEGSATSILPYLKYYIFSVLILAFLF